MLYCIGGSNVLPPTLKEIIDMVLQYYRGISVICTDSHIYVNNHFPSAIRNFNGAVLHGKCVMMYKHSPHRKPWIWESSRVKGVLIPILAKRLSLIDIDLLHDMEIGRVFYSNGYREVTDQLGTRKEPELICRSTHMF